jgi:hypothetical protein
MYALVVMLMVFHGGQMDEKKSQVLPILMADFARLEYFEIINYLNLYC